MSDRRNARSVLGSVAMALATTTSAYALDEVSMGTGWLAQAEHGGFYQAVADGTYEKHGLKVTILMGGPQSPNRARLIAGQVQFIQGSTLGALDAVANEIPTTTVAAIFQKDPQALLAHPGVGIETIADLAKLETIFLGGDGYDTFFRWLKATYPGFRDSQYKPYTYNPAPFIADPTSGQQAYITSEPLNIRKQAGWDPQAFLLADYGYTGYATTIETQVELVENKPDLVKRFVEASIIGWYNYLYGDNAAANELIKKDNPEMTDEQIDYSIAQMKKYEIVLAADAKEKGIGCMTDERYAGFYKAMVDAGVLDGTLDLSKAYTTQFVCKGVGMDLYKDMAAN
jgi:NitT/TauT family transport system substrate-binding protein